MIFVTCQMKKAMKTTDWEIKVLNVQHMVGCDGRARWSDIFHAAKGPGNSKYGLDACDAMCADGRRREWA